MKFKKLRTKNKSTPKKSTKPVESLLNTSYRLGDKVELIHGNTIKVPDDNIEFTRLKGKVIRTNAKSIRIKLIGCAPFQKRVTELNIKETQYYMFTKQKQ